MTKVSIVDLIAKKMKRCIAIVEDGDTASQSIASGKFVIWKGNPYKASTAISSGDTLSTSNLTALSDGIGNELNSKITSIEPFTLTAAANVSNLYQNCCKYGRIIQISCEFTITSTTGKTLGDLLTVPEAYRPTANVYFAFLDNTNDKAMSGRLTTSGLISAFRDYTTAVTNVRFTFFYII